MCGLSSTYYNEYIEEINIHKSKFKNLEVFIGFESKILEKIKSIFHLN